MHFTCNRIAKRACRFMLWSLRAAMQLCLVCSFLSVNETITEQPNMLRMGCCELPRSNCAAELQSRSTKGASPYAQAHQHRGQQQHSMNMLHTSIAVLQRTTTMLQLSEKIVAAQHKYVSTCVAAEQDYGFNQALLCCSSASLCSKEALLRCRPACLCCKQVLLCCSTA